MLTGDTFTQQIRALDNLFSQTNDNSGELRLTLRDDMQAVAKFLLGPREGSIVLMEIDTGAIVAMWSYPSFDPNLVADPDYEAAFDYVTELQADERDPCSPTPTSSATCRVRPSRCSRPGLRSTQA